MKAARFDATLLLRAGLAASKHRLGDTVHAALFEAVWAGRADLTSEHGRSDFVAVRGIAADLWSLASDPALDELLLANTAEAASRGAFGVPTMFLGDEMFFGNDRLNFIAMLVGDARRDPVTA